VDFTLSDEQRLIVDTVRTFVEKELYPHEDEVERLDEVPAELAAQIRRKAIAAGLYAANMPAELGGGGLDAVSVVLAERELGRASYALQMLVERPSNILRGCNSGQRERYLLPAIRGERHDCVAMTEPGSGSDVRSMSTAARRDGDCWIINGTKHFISHADVADFIILFAATGGFAGPKRQITAFLVDRDSPGLVVTRGLPCVSNRGYHQCELSFTDCRVPAANLLGEEGHGFDLMGQWLGASRLTVAATSVGRARRVLDAVTGWAATRRQFGQPVGRFQGVGFQLADCATHLEAAELLTLRAAAKCDQGTMTDADAAMAKLYASEMLGRMTDTAVQVFGGMGLMSAFPAERWWRDARVERIWDGTSEIQRHIIARSLLRPYGALWRLRPAPTVRSWSSRWTGRRPTRSTCPPAVPCTRPSTGCARTPDSASRC
jgi:acyl-CoA dehydrogenase